MGTGGASPLASPGSSSIGDLAQEAGLEGGSVDRRGDGIGAVIRSAIQQRASRVN
jgi:hypothetical protein